MKRFLSRLLAAFGLVSAGRYNALSRAAEELKAASQDWKVKAGEERARAKSVETELRRQRELAERNGIVAEKLRRRRDDVDKLRIRLKDAERELTVARDHLMAIEVKLDILEGAANVLDKRTRSAAPPDRRGTGANA
jgi:multidrug resistance efflux pump